jgi:hypothetical protein
MKVVKQIYIYVLTYASLVMMLWGAVRIGGLLINMLIGPTRDTILVGRNLRDEFSTAGAMFLVGLLVWAIHWWLAQRSVNAAGPEGQQERRSTFRKLLIYGVLFTAGWQITFAAAEFIRVVLTSLPDDLGSGAVRGVLAYAVPTFIVYGLAWWYYWRVRRVDNEVVAETGHAATVRRWYYYLASYLGLSAVMFALSDLIRFTWRTITADSRPWLVGDGWVLLPVATSVGWLLAAGAVWLLQWTTAQRIAAGSTEERHSLLRKVYLYGVILQTAAVTLVMATGFVYNLVRMWLGNDQFPAEGESLLSAVLMPLATALAYGTFWAYHWLTLRAEIRAVPDEPGLQLSLRGVYSYPVAVAGLSTLAVGLSALLRYLFDIAFNGSTTTGLTRAESADQVSFFASTLLVGAAAWGVSWVLLQRTALSPEGVEMRQSLARRVYLYGVLLACSIALLVSGFWLVYWLFRHVGDTITGALISDITWPAGVLITAGVLLTYHALTLRADQRAKALMPAPAPALAVEPAPTPPVAPLPATVVLIRTLDLGVANAAIAAVRSTVGEHAEVEVLSAPGVTAAELSGWLARRAEGVQQPASDAAPAQSETPIEKSTLL